MNEYKTNVVKRYLDVYRDTFDEVSELYREEYSLGSVNLQLLNHRDLSVIDEWKGYDFNGVHRGPPNGGWEWRGLELEYRKKPKRYCVSFLSGDDLCGVLAGSISKGGEVVSMKYIEAAPYRTKLSGEILNLSMTFSLSLALRVDAKYVAAYEPNENLSRVITSTYGAVNDNALYGSVEKRGLNPHYIDVSDINK